ncbi:LacI family DNA-binding transcriptional regulator [Kribbella sp. NPDC058693]|uniref:LacI family transcriptional regulator n=1 Tax=Kribbella jiaozuonensis TaxID=2575441 RepID=A0A4V5UVF1_9ACTN|nr:LacI family DNA-binding transcriptional regulator [Kribbella jiaozuonensis]TKK72873.1 LacI family transcriptional regulator [Kribbella jiaozuonensis]TKK74103.1 LacI family transcriptional regulator [Kribbella jiaozuonensis]
MASSLRSQPRITDVAALAGVSTSTASKALNDTGQLREETRERVRRAAEQLGFTPDSRGRALSSGRSFTVGLITTDSSGRFSIPIMLGAEDALSAGEMALVLCDTRDDPLREQHYLKSLVSRRVDGIIVTGRRTEPRAPIDVPIPVIYAFSPSTDPDDTSVIVDDHGGAGSAVRHLLSLGRSKIAYVTGPDSHHSARVRAAATIEAAGDAFAGEPLHGEWSERWGRHAVDVLLRAQPAVDAIACGSDQIARGVCDRLRELSRSVPDDIAVTGYDNWSVMALASRPPLTTVDMELEELGRRTANLLLDAIAGSAHPGPMELPTRLITRESTLGT